MLFFFLGSDEWLWYTCILPWRGPQTRYRHTSKNTRDTLKTCLWFPSSKSTNSWNGALVNVLSLWKKKLKKKNWKQRYWVLAVCDCKRIVLEEKIMTLFKGTVISKIFLLVLLLSTLYSFCNPTPPTPHSTYLLTTIHPSTCTGSI